MKKVKTILFRLVILIFAVVLIVVLPTISFSKDDDISLIYSTFIGKKSEYKGMIEVWNIDSFEGGFQPKVKYIEKCAIFFQSKNKGIYILIRNITESECENMLKSGQIPDIISCSYGVASKIKDKVVSFDNPSSKVFKNLLEAGKGDDGKIYGLAWCMGFYSLISTKEKLEKAGKDFENVNLNEVALDCDYNFKPGKNTITSYSLCYGTSAYLMPKNALMAYNKARFIQINNSSETSEISLKSQYSAYCTFLSNGSTILLGTQRDVFRMENRVKQSKVSDVVYLPLLNYTDLIQFCFLCKNDNETKKYYAEMFANSLVEQADKQNVETIGMLPVTRVTETNFEGIMKDIALQNNGNYEVFNVFQGVRDFE